MIQSRAQEGPFTVVVRTHETGPVDVLGTVTYLRLRVNDNRAYDRERDTRRPQHRRYPWRHVLTPSACPLDAILQTLFVGHAKGCVVGPFAHDSASNASKHNAKIQFDVDRGRYPDAFGDLCELQPTDGVSERSEDPTPEANRLGHLELDQHKTVIALVHPHPAGRVVQRVVNPSAHRQVTSTRRQRDDPARMAVGLLLAHDPEVVA